MSNLARRLWTEWPTDFFTPFTDSQQSQYPAQSSMTMMDVDITESDGSVLVEADVPGVNREDIDISVEGGYLTLRAERNSKREKTEEEGNVRTTRRQRRYGQFSRSFRLADDLDPEKIEAKLENGVLAVTIPKKAESQVRKIEVKT